MPGRTRRRLVHWKRPFTDFLVSSGMIPRGCVEVFDGCDFTGRLRHLARRRRHPAQGRMARRLEGHAHTRHQHGPPGLPRRHRAERDRKRHQLAVRRRLRHRAALGGYASRLRAANPYAPTARLTDIAVLKRDTASMSYDTRRNKRRIPRDLPGRRPHRKHADRLYGLLAVKRRPHNSAAHGARYALRP